MHDTIFYSKKFGIYNIVHGFFTKRFPDFCKQHSDSYLNVALGRKSTDKNVFENRNIVAQSLGTFSKFFFTSQNHTNIVQIIESSTNFNEKTMPFCDALVTNIPHTILGIYTADCVPILLCDPWAHVIGVAHCGWKGLQSKIIKSTVEAMQNKGAQKIMAALGPCIRKNFYCVDREFLLNFPQDEDCIFEKEEKFFIDLPALAIKQLKNLKVQDIDDVEINTYEYEDLFFSYRRSLERNQPLEGAQASVIML